MKRDVWGPVQFVCIFIAAEALPFPHARGMRFASPVGPARAIFPVARRCQSCFTPDELMAALWQ